MKFILIIVLATFQTVLGNPKFAWDLNLVSRSQIPLLKIDFPQRNYRDVAHLRVSKFVQNVTKDDSCIFEGNLEQEPNVPIAVFGCPGSTEFEVTVSKRDLKSEVLKASSLSEF
jgi:hypothetical protein